MTPIRSHVRRALLGVLPLLTVALLVVVAVRATRERPAGAEPPDRGAGTGDTATPPAEANSPTADVPEPGERQFLRAIARPVSAAALAAAGVPPARRVRLAEVAPAWRDRKTSPWLAAQVAGAEIPLELWDDLPLVVRVQDSVVVGQDRQLVRGTIDGVPDSRFLLTMSGEAMAFSVYLGPEQRHGAVTLADGTAAIFEIDPAASPGCGGTLPALPDSDAFAVDQARPFAARTGALISGTPGSTGAVSSPPVAAAVPTAIAQIDVLMLYTNEVLASATPNSALITRVDLAIGEANDEYARSETRVQLRLVGLQQVTYTETGSNATALDRLRQTQDGFLDTVHAARDDVGADLVCLLVQRNDPSNIGIAYVLSTLSDPDRRFNDLFAFSVVQNAWITGTGTFSHELGHNLGCAHDRENSSSAGAFPYSYGYRFVGGDSRTYRTIMAYQPGTSVPYFSNPRLTHPVAQRALGVGAGLAGEADNATSINQAAHFVASYRSNRRDLPARGRLYNVSTRAWVGTGDDVMIGGFFVGAPGPKQVLIRVRGPELTQFNVADALLDPEVELVDQTTHETIRVNNDWAAAPNASAIVATGLAPADPREPAILVSLPPGGYTAVARGVGNTSGVALVEVFEVDGASAPKLVNLSTRGFVDTGDRVMIGGVIVNGTPGETKRLVFRALGPSLADFGVAHPLHDPALRLYNENSEELMDNDDWDFLSDTLQAQLQALGLVPAVRRESVLVVDLPPGLYTLVVRPFENDTGIESGIGLIEAYEITTP